MSLIEVLEAGVRNQKHQLEDEFRHWRARTAKDPVEAPDRPRHLPEHHSQVARITAQLERLLQSVATESPADGSVDGSDGDGRIERARANRRAVHRVHILWDFFRRKLALRDTPTHRDMLACADDFAWACFQPALEYAAARNLIAVNAQRTPPLVYLADEQGPIMRGRDEGYGILEARDLPVALIHSFREVGRHLPVPIIGLPWHDAHRLPPILFVAHEVGHVLSDDLGWLEAVKRQIENSAIAAERRESWLSWTDELCADAYGVLCGGDAYVAMLALENLDARSQVAVEMLPNARGRWLRYPTRWLRLFLAKNLREGLGYPDWGAWDAWTDACGTTHGMSDWEADIPHIQDILLTGDHLRDLGIDNLGALLDWPRSIEVTDMADNLQQRGGHWLGGQPVQTIVLAAALAYFRNASAFSARRSSELFAEYAEARKPHLKARGVLALVERTVSQQALNQQLDADPQRDRGLAELLGLQEPSSAIQ